MIKSFLFIIIILVVASCTNTKEEIEALFNTDVFKEERARNVEIIYSDSAQIKLKITAPTLVRFVDKNSPQEEFPDGLTVDFYDDRGNVSSWLKANYAIRKEDEKKIIVQDDVVLYNKKNDQLDTNELIWDETTGKLHTEKYVRISQPSRGDTIYGHGFSADQEFQRFKISRKVSALKNIEDFSDLLNK